MSDTPTKQYHISCSHNCSMNPINLGEDLAKLLPVWVGNGHTLERMLADMQALGVTRSMSALVRHRKSHMHEVIIRADGQTIVQGGEVNELDLLNRMISEGAKQVEAGTIRLTGEQLLRAMDLKLKLTQGSVYDHMYEAMRKAMGDDLDADFEASEDSVVEGLGEGQDEP